MLRSVYGGFNGESSEKKVPERKQNRLQTGANPFPLTGLGYAA